MTPLPKRLTATIRNHRAGYRACPQPGDDMARSQTETVSAQGGMDLLTRPDPLPHVDGPPEPEADTEEAGGRRTTHPEVKLLGSLLRQLMEATPGTRRRVMGFLVDLINEGEQQ